MAPIYVSSAPANEEYVTQEPTTTTSETTTQYLTVTVPKASTTILVSSVSSQAPIGQASSTASVVYVVQTLSVVPIISPTGGSPSGGRPVATGSVTGPATPKFTGGADGLRANGAGMGLVVAVFAMLVL